MVAAYYNKLFRTGTDRQNSILMSLLLFVVETKIRGFALSKKSFMKKNVSLFLNFGISIVLLLWRQHTVRTFFKTPFSKSVATINFPKKYCLQVI